MPHFSPIVGHQNILEQLETDIAQDNVSHAYLFSGVSSLGKMATAHWFAEKLLGLEVPEEERSDLHHHMENLTHPDLFVLDQLYIDDQCDDWDVIAQTSNVPQHHRSKAPKAKTDSIGIEEIRAMHDRLHETSTGKYRVCIIRSVERMHTEAANAFLKILEEPPAGLVFILTTQAKTSLLPTIVSRVRPVSFAPLSHAEMLPLLADISSEDAGFILKLAQGAPGTAKRLASDPDALREEKQLHESAHSFWKSTSLKERLHLLEPLHKRGDDAEQLLLHLGLTLRTLGAQQKTDWTPAYTSLTENLQHTNTHRQLLAQEFALVTNP